MNIHFTPALIQNAVFAITLLAGLPWLIRHITRIAEQRGLGLPDDGAWSDVCWGRTAGGFEFVIICMVLHLMVLYAVAGLALLPLGLPTPSESVAATVVWSLLACAQWLVVCGLLLGWIVVRARGRLVTVGELAIVSAMCGVRFDIPPYVMAEGTPAEPRNVNVIGLRRAGIAEADVADLREAFRDLYHDRGATPLREAVEEVRDRFQAKTGKPVLRLCDWIEAHLEHAIKGRMAEAHRTAVVGGTAASGATRQVTCRHCGKDFAAVVRSEAYLAACTHCGRQQTVEAQT